MSDTTGYVRNPVRLIVDLVLALVGSVLFTLGAVVSGWRMIWCLIQTQPYIDYLLLLVRASSTLIFLTLSVLAILGVRSMWFVQYKYRLIDGTLEAIDPILRKRWVVEIDAVRCVRGFDVLQGSHDIRSRTGHLLDVQDGITVPVSEALPLWPEIAKRCSNALFQEAKMPWWANKTQK